MTRASENLFDALHLLTAQKLAEIIRDGLPVMGEDEDGTPVIKGYIPVPAAYISAAIKFLKDNDITADTNSARLKNLGHALDDIPDFPDDDRPYN